MTRSSREAHQPRKATRLPANFSRGRVSPLSASGKLSSLQLHHTHLDLLATMGKRSKSTRKPGGGKKKEILETVFSCIFCQSPKVRWCVCCYSLRHSPTPSTLRSGCIVQDRRLCAYRIPQLQDGEYGCAHAWTLGPLLLDVDRTLTSCPSNSHPQCGQKFQVSTTPLTAPIDV